MPSGHCIRGALRAALATLALAWPIAAAAQPIESGGTTLQYFLRGVPIGTEQVIVSRTADGWTIASSGRLAPPIDAVARRIEVRYTADWHPREFTLDGTARGQSQSIRTVVDGTTAQSRLNAGGQISEKSDTIDPNAVLILPTSFFGPFEAVAERLRTTPAGTDIQAYAVPALSFTIRVGETSTQQIQTPARMIAAKRTTLKLQLPGAALDGEIWTDESGRMIRFSIPAQALEVVREDVASVAARSVPISRPNDEPIKIPSNGFTLAGTLSRPTNASAARIPAVVLVGGSGSADRDEMVFNIPIFGQVAGALADAGFMVVRYDKRGIGQSGGRAESASFEDYAEDVRAVVKLLSDRKDVDPKRIAVVGHSEGGSIALMAAAKDKRIAAVGCIATIGMRGADVILAQQQHLLNRSQLSPEEKQSKIELQKKIHEAVLSGKGVNDLPPELRRVASSTEFQNILAFDPAKVMPDVRQPILILQGELDVQVEPANADRLEELANKRKGARPVEKVKLPGINHLLVPATTGEVDEYGSLKDKHVSDAVTQALVSWLKKTL